MNKWLKLLVFVAIVVVPWLLIVFALGGCGAEPPPVKPGIVIWRVAPDQGELDSACGWHTDRGWSCWTGTAIVTLPPKEYPAQTFQEVMTWEARHAQGWSQP